MSEKKRDDASSADNAERHNAAAPPAAGTGTDHGGKPKVSAAGTPEVVPGQEDTGRHSAEKPSRS